MGEGQVGYFEKVLPDREAWLVERFTGLGSSDAAAVIGQSHWKSRFALWAEKKHRADLSPEESVFLKKGHQLEPLIAADYVEATGRDLVDLGSWTIRRSKRWPWMICTHDRLILPCDGNKGTGVLSAKAVLSRFGRARDQWAELLAADPGDERARHLLAEQVRLDYQTQIQHEMIVSDLQWGDLGIWFPDQPLLIVHFDRNEAFCDYLIEEERAFWVESIVGDVVPEVDGDASTTKAVKQLYGAQKEGVTVDLDDEQVTLADERVALKERIKADEKRLSEVENAIKVRIGDAEIGLLPDGRSFSFRKVHRDGYAVAPVDYRELRLKKAPGAPKTKRSSR